MALLSENTRINLNLVSLFALGAMIATASIRLFVDESQLNADHRKLKVTMDRVDALANPDKQWAKDYWQKSHEHDYE